MQIIATLFQTKTICLSLIFLIGLSILPLPSPAQPAEASPGAQETFTEASFDRDYIYTWSTDQQKFALADTDRVLVLDTKEHTLDILDLPAYPSLVRVILSLGFNPSGTKLFAISLVDEPDIDSNVMEIHLLSLDGEILASRFLTNLADAQWISEDLIRLVFYLDLDGEEQEIKEWNLQQDEIVEISQP